MVDTFHPCPSLAGRIFGHKFFPRYNELGQKLDPFFATYGTYKGPAYQRTYQGDVCTRCGLAVNKTSGKA
jgi:hypothetical protein